jgi:hypothetical protein
MQCYIIAGHRSGIASCNAGMISWLFWGFIQITGVIMTFIGISVGIGNSLHSTYAHQVESCTMNWQAYHCSAIMWRIIAGTRKHAV